MSSEQTPTTDGRRLRREQGRLAAIDAWIDLMLAGGPPPTAEQVAKRAGVSVASLHRYFDSLDQMRLVGLQRYLERIDHLLDIPDVGVGSLTSRVDRLVAARLDYHETTINVARTARRSAADIGAVGDTLRRIRSTLAEQLDQHFATELAALSDQARRERVAVLAALTSFETWDQLTEQGLDREAIARAWADSLLALLDLAA
jgi:AcrR family transcriptional regulator